MHHFASRRQFLKTSMGALALGAMPISALAAPTIAGHNWMNSVRSTLLLSDLTIPGTHDSAAKHGGGLFQTQTLSIPEQLQAGVRYLDLRLALVKGTFRLHHGPMDMKLSLTEALQSIKQFLVQNPSETVIICVQQEHTKFDDPTIRTAFAQHIQPFRDIIFDQAQMPYLGQVRGKIVVVTRNLGISGIRYSQAQVSDHYSIITAKKWHEEKWPRVKEHLFKARNAPRNNSVLWITTTSSTGAFLYPYGASKLMNPALKRFFQDAEHVPLAHEARFGVIVMDYVTPDLVNQIAALNFGFSKL